MADITGYPYGKLPGGWEDDVLKSLNAPVTVGNVHFLDSWEMLEQGSPAQAAQYNPFNTTQGGSGTTSAYSNLSGGSSIWNYKDWQSGLNATIATLTGSKAKQFHYDDIVSQLQSGKINQNQDVVSAGLLTWGAGTYGDINTAQYPNLPSTSFNGAPKDNAVPVGSDSSSGSSGNTNPSSSPLSISPWLIVAIVLVAIFVVLK